MLILGSTSPRRAELLIQLGLTFHRLSPDIDETVHPDETPKAYVERMAREKFEALVGGDHIDARDVLLTADTVVVSGEEILGKPRDETEATEILEKLSGNSHSVFTAVTVGSKEAHNQQFTVETKVHFRRLNYQEIAAYWRTGEPQDKAGAYGIQGMGAVFVERIEGSYSNVVGLPLTETAQALAAFGITILG